MIQSSPSRRAWVRRLRTSLPPSGSEIGERGELEVARLAEALGRPAQQLLGRRGLRHRRQRQPRHHDRQPDPRAAPEQLLHEQRQREAGRVADQVAVEERVVEALLARPPRAPATGTPARRRSAPRPGAPPPRRSGGCARAGRAGRASARGRSSPLHHRHDALAAGRADRDQPAAGALLGQQLGQRGDDPPAGGGERVPGGQRGAVDVELVAVDRRRGRSSPRPRAWPAPARRTPRGSRRSRSPAASGRPSRAASGRRTRAPSAARPRR